MENTLLKLLEIFKYLLRDIIIYALPGFLFFFLFFFLKLPFEPSLVSEQTTIKEYYIIISIVISYYMGHLIMGLMYLVCELTLLEKIWKRKMGIDDVNSLEKEIFIFNYNKLLYDEYIERYSILCLFRWNLSGVFLILFLISIITNGISYVAILLFILFLSFLQLHYVTYKDYVERVEKAFLLVQKTFNS